MADIEIVKINGTKVGDIRDARSNAEYGLGYATCSTAGATAAKEANLTDFVLRANARISVLFTYAFVAADSTLNVNNTGAKPIKYYGSNIPNHVVKNNTIVDLVYDGTNYNVVGVNQKPADSDLWVDMGLPSGVKWAKKSIDMTQANHFCASEFQYECTFYSWGNNAGENPADSSSFTTGFGTGNETEPYVSSMGAKLTGNIPISQDTARAALGAPWRMPTTEEFKELIDNCDFIDASGTVIGSSATDKRVTVNGVLGIYLQSKINGNRLFFACSGYGNGTSWNYRGSYGYYWSSSLHSATDGRSLGFSSGGVNPQYGNGRCRGFAVRAVQ